jgi:hypothetical protein
MLGEPKGTEGSNNKKSPQFRGSSLATPARRDYPASYRRRALLTLSPEGRLAV